MIVANYM